MVQCGMGEVSPGPALELPDFSPLRSFGRSVPGSSLLRRRLGKWIGGKIVAQQPGTHGVVRESDRGGTTFPFSLTQEEIMPHCRAPWLSRPSCKHSQSHKLIHAC